MQHRVTQDTIAKALGLSLKTVQRAFAGSDKVSPKTMADIRDYAAEAGYRYNRSARALGRKKQPCIRLFSSASPEYFWSKVARGLDIALRETRDFGFRALYHPVPQQDTAAYMRLLHAAFYEGMDAAAIVNNPEFDMSRVFGFLDHKSIPYITLNIDAPETHRLVCVGPDYGEGGRIAAEFMGKTIPPDGSILIIHNPVDSEHALAGSHINEDRLLNFVSYLSVHFPGLKHQVVSFSSRQSRNEIEAELEDLLLEGEHKIHGIYSIAEIQGILGRQILRLGLEGRFIILVHGLAPQTEMYLRSHAFTAAIQQNPVMQGYYAVRVLEYYLERTMIPARLPSISQRILMGTNIGDEDNFTRFSDILSAETTFFND